MKSIHFFTPNIQDPQQFEQNCEYLLCVQLVEKLNGFSKAQGSITRGKFHHFFILGDLQRKIFCLEVLSDSSKNKESNVKDRIEM